MSGAAVPEFTTVLVGVGRRVFVLLPFDPDEMWAGGSYWSGGASAGGPDAAETKVRRTGTLLASRSRWGWG